MFLVDETDEITSRGKQKRTSLAHAWENEYGGMFLLTEKEYFKKVKSITIR